MINYQQQLEDLLRSWPQEALEVLGTGWGTTAQEGMDDLAVPIIEDLAGDLGISVQQAALALCYSLLNTWSKS
jgi:hypothetical protein